MKKCISHILLIAIFLGFLQIPVGAQELTPETVMSADNGQEQFVPSEASEQAALESELDLADSAERQRLETIPLPGQSEAPPTADTELPEDQEGTIDGTDSGDTDQSPSETKPTVPPETETIEPSDEETTLPPATEKPEEPSKSDLPDPDSVLPKPTETGEETERTSGLPNTQEKSEDETDVPQEMMRAKAYSYQIIPLIENIGYFVYVKTNDPDPQSFRFVDKNSIYGKDALYQLKKHLFKDVQYENKSTYRVSGGYIFEYENSMPDGGKMILQKKNKAGDFVNTNQTVTLPRLVNSTDYLLDTYTNDSMSGYEKLDAVQAALDKLAVYPNAFHDESQPTGRYPFFLASVYRELGIMKEYNYLYQTAKSPDFAYWIYPYILDSSSFPGTMIDIALKINPAANYERTDYHWEIKIKLAAGDEGKTYGGAGQGDSNSVGVSHIAAIFDFSKSKSALKNDFSLERLKSNLRSLKQRADQDVAQYEDILGGDTFKATIGKSSWIELNRDGGWIVDGVATYGTELSYVHQAYNQEYHFASDAWVDGRYINAWEWLDLGATFADHPHADIIVQDMEYTDKDGKQHKNDVVFSYDQTTDTWRAPYYYSNDNWYYSSMVLPDEFILTEADVLAMNPDRNTNRIPTQGRYYVYNHKPGTPFSRIPVSGIELANKSITVRRDHDKSELPIKVTPANAYEKRIDFSSDNADIAYAVCDDESGKCTVIGVEVGETYITAKTLDGAYSVRFKVKVTDDRNDYYVQVDQAMVYNDYWESVDTRYIGECLFGKIEDNYFIFEKDGESFKIEANMVTLTPQTGTAYANSKINIRSAATGKIITSTRIGQAVRGIQKADGYIYFDYNGQKVKAWAAYMTYAVPADYYIKSGSNIRNQNLNLIGHKYRGDSIRGIALEGAPYVRFVENGSVKLIHQSLVSTEPIEITCYVNATLNVRDAWSNEVLYQSQIGDELTGVKQPDGYLHFYDGWYRRSLKVWAAYLTRKENKNYYVASGSNIRDQSLSIVDYKNRGELVRGTHLKNTNYIRFEENGMIRLIHQSMVTTSPIVRTAYAQETVNVRSASTGKVIGKLYKGNMVKGIQKADGYIYITYKNQSAKVWAEYVGPLEVTAYANGTVNVRAVADNKILGNYLIGSEIIGSKNDTGYIYFKGFWGMPMKVWANILTNKADQNFYLKEGSNIRNQYMEIVNTKSRGELIRGTRLRNTNYVRFEEDGYIRLIHQNQVTTSPIVRTGYANETVNVRSASTGKIIGTLYKGNTLKGIEKPDGYIYITYRNQSAKVWADYVSSYR